LQRPFGRPFSVVFVTLLCLAAAPFWVTTLLPAMDYPQFLGFARAFRDLSVPGSPFYGTYTVGFPLSPLILPLLVMRGLSAFVTLEIAGKIIITAYAVGLPLVSLRLLRVLDKDPAQVFLVFPLIFSYWLSGGFFAYFTGMPLLVLGLSEGISWSRRPSLWRGAWLAGLLCAAFLWHALVFAELVQALFVLWVCARAEDIKARLRLLLPILPALGLFAVWMALMVLKRSSGEARHLQVVFRAPLESAGEFLHDIGMLVPEGTGHIALFGVLLLLFFRFDPPSRKVEEAFSVKNPFAVLALYTALGALVFPLHCFGVEGISNRKCWIAALYLVFALRPPARGSARALALGAAMIFDTVLLGHFVERFHRFDAESIGASRLIDRLAPFDTLLAPMDGVTRSFPVKPLIHVEVYASVRRGGLPNKSFAGYDINVIRYVGGKNPMPSLNLQDWSKRPDLTRLDWVLLHGPAVNNAPKRLSLVARDGEWGLFSICDSRKGPPCP